MKDLPYFLALVKKNLILWTIITTGSFSKVDFGNAQHDFHPPHFLILKNYALSKDDKFKDISIRTDQYETTIVFENADPKYLQNLKYYFGTDKITGRISDSNPIDKEITPVRMLGPIKLGMETGVTVGFMRSGIMLTYYSKAYYLRERKELDSLTKVYNLKN